MDCRVSRRPSRRWLARRLFSLVIGAAVLLVPHAILRAAAGAPIRAFWVSRAALDSPDTIRRALATAVSDGFIRSWCPCVGDGGSELDGAREMLGSASVQRRVRVAGSEPRGCVAKAARVPKSRCLSASEWLMVSRELAPEI